MSQLVDVKSALPLCGGALTLTGAGQTATSLPEETVRPSAQVERQGSERNTDSEPRTFYHFTDIDFREIMGVKRYEESESVASVSSRKGSELAGGTKENIGGQKSAPSSGLELLAVGSLFGLPSSKREDRQSRSLLNRLITSSGGPDPEPEKKPKPIEPAGAIRLDVRVEKETPSTDAEKKPGIRQIVAKLWKLWEKPTDLFPSPWNTVVKWGVPVVAATCGAVWFQTVVQVGILGTQLLGGVLKPLAGAAAFIVPMTLANSIFKGVEKVFHLEPTSAWKRQAIVKPIQVGLGIGAAIWTHAVGLSPITYGLWAAAAVGAGYVATKIFKNSKATTWTSVAAAVALPWTHVLTQRTFVVTVLNAGPDPEVGAWNITTDLSKADHWKSVAFFGTPKAPNGKSGMVFLNRDVPLYFPPHREANEFNGEFANLIGKPVEVTTIGAWLKPLSPKLQPTIVKYRILEQGTNSSPNTVSHAGK